MAIGNWKIESLEMALTDMSRINSQLAVRLHGILGIAFLRRQKMAINFRERKLYFWRQGMEALAKNNVCLPEMIPPVTEKK
jgi:hypothetical protein